MNLSEEQKHELIQDYLEDTLSEERAAIFEQLLNDDKEFQTQVILEKAFFEEHERALQAELEKEVMEVSQLHEAANRTPIYKLPVFRIAASLVAIALCAWLLLGGSGDEQVIDSSRMSLLQLEQTTLGLVPNPDKTLSEFDLQIVKNKDYDFHYSFDEQQLKLYLKEPVDVGLIRLAYQARANMYLLFIRDTAYEIFPRKDVVSPLEPFN